MSMIDIVYFSNYSGNTKRFVEKLTDSAIRIPINFSESEELRVDREYVLFLPTYGGGNDSHTVPRQVRKFLKDEVNKKLIRGVVGFGNTNFGEHYCKASELVSKKFNVPLLAKVEIFGTNYDVEKVKNRLEILYDWQ
jgi:protein involved in ribonucleotide reduction